MAVFKPISQGLERLSAGHETEEFGDIDKPNVNLIRWKIGCLAPVTSGCEETFTFETAWDYFFCVCVSGGKYGLKCIFVLWGNCLCVYGSPCHVAEGSALKSFSTPMGSRRKDDALNFSRSFISLWSSSSAPPGTAPWVLVGVSR